MGAVKEFYAALIEEGMREKKSKKRDYPILFETEMVQAILSGTKTQTRRAFRSPLSKMIEPANEIWHDGAQWIARKKNGQCFNHKFSCPYGKIGDLLWVKETWAPAMGEIAYKADYSKDVLSEERNKGIWHPSIHMPKTAARLWLEITDIKAQRLQTISEQDAFGEGCGVDKIFGFSENGQSNHREGFFSKWIAIYGLESYHENPWIWALKFKVV
jgi:hypothetical protein